MAVMSCPTPDVLTKVRMQLSGEPVNQVGSFVWTFLENLKESSAPLKQELASILEDVKLREDFNLDVRKYSRNMEKSLFSEYLNAGAHVSDSLPTSHKLMPSTRVIMHCYSSMCRVYIADRIEPDLVSEVLHPSLSHG